MGSLNGKRCFIKHYEKEEKGGEDVEVVRLGKTLASSLEQGSGGADR